jgi:hypothetical protein
MQAKKPVGLFLSSFFIFFLFYNPFWFFHKKLPFNKLCFAKPLHQLAHKVNILKQGKGFLIKEHFIIDLFSSHL